MNSWSKPKFLLFFFIVVFPAMVLVNAFVIALVRMAMGRAP